MSLQTDLLIDRRRLKRRLSFWRALALLALLATAFVLLRPLLPVGGAHLVRLAVNGVITEDPQLTAAVRALADDPSVRGLIVAIDSPGGSVAGGEALHDAIAAVAARKPVVAVMGGTATSAGYMVALPAARIFARASTLTGSIGVLLQTGEISGLLGKLGITAEAITSGPLKDQPSLLHPTSPAGEVVLHALVADLYDQFVAMVAASRHLPLERVRALADGRAYTGRQALDLGLIDAIGGESAARAWLASARGVPADLPTRPLRSRSLTARLLLGEVAPALGDTVKSMLSQWVTIDGAWAIWQPAAHGG
jgi:protease-4